MWTSAVTEPYMTITVHFIDKTWNLQSFCLNTVPVFAGHTGQNIADAVVDIFDNWQLSTDKLVAATTDSGSNIVAAFNNLCESATLVIILTWPSKRALIYI